MQFYVFAIIFTGPVALENHKKTGQTEEATSSKPAREPIGIKRKWPRPSKTTALPSSSGVKFMVCTVSQPDSLGVTVKQNPTQGTD